MKRWAVLLVCATMLALNGCGEGDGDESFSCELTRTISSDGMELTRAYDCPDESSCDACSGGDCDGCTLTSEPPDPSPVPSEPDTAMCTVGLVLAQGESCSFDDGQNMFTLRVNAGGQCCFGAGICGGEGVQINRVAFNKNAAGNCEVVALP